MFAHLHTHSSFSFLDSLVSPAELVEAAVREEIPALALTDLNGMTGAIEFFDACRASGIQPILGLDLTCETPSDVTPRTAGVGEGQIVLLAMDMRGWSNLCHLSSIANSPEEIASFEDLAQHAEGLICLTGGRRGLAAELARQGREKAAARLLGDLADLFADRLYIELQRHGPDDDNWIEALAHLAQHEGIQLVATHNIHYLEPGQADRQRLLSAIRLNCPLAELPSGAPAAPEAYFLSSEEMLARFPDHPSAIARTSEIAERCHLELPLGIPHFPEISLPPGQSIQQVLREKAEAGARALYHPLNQRIQARLDQELAVIEKSGFAPLFLIMEEILAFTRRAGIPTASRGSAASSLVAHCLGVTDPEPIRLDLYFERFLNPARATPPDIDTDLCSRRRDEVIHFVYERFGADRVAMVCTINRFRQKSALRETAKAYGLPLEQITRMAEDLPWRRSRQAEEDGGPYGALRGSYPSPTHQAIFRDAAALIGLPHHLSVHPGGMVITPGPIHELIPTFLAPKGVVITQFDLDSIERLGLVKIDLLGIRGLTVLGDVAQALGKRQASQDHHTRPLEFLNSIPADDPLTRETVRNGRTIGCFQIESPGMRATLKSIQAQNADDIMVALSLFRPGPLTGGLWDAFVRRHRGEEPPAYLHPSLEPLLKDTFGVILYQEQVLRIAHQLAGLSLGDADLLRRAMSHFDPGKQMQTLKEKFIEGALKLSGVPESTAERIWELMAAFAGYGFPKAHAASYAEIGWRSAWCKTHHPAIFMAAVLANWGGYYSQRVYLSEVRKLGLALKGPHVNFAAREFSVRFLNSTPTLFMGLNQVKELTQKTQARILRQRPFGSLEEFLARVDPRPVEAEHLARAGALEGMGTIPALLARLEGGGWRGGQLSLFSWLAPNPEEDWSLEQKIEAQEAILGVSVSAHRLELYTRAIAESGAVTTSEAVEHRGLAVRVAGVPLISGRRFRSRGAYGTFTTLEDLDGMLEIAIPPEVYRRAKSILFTRAPVLVEGIVAFDQELGEPFLSARRIERLEKA